jgi:hypothetical protein
MTTFNKTTFTAKQPAKIEFLHIGNHSCFGVRKLAFGAYAE